LTPDFAVGHSNIALYHWHLGEYQQAIEAGRRSLAIDSNNHQAYWALGLSLDSQGEHQGALEAYECALKIKPETSELWHNIGEVYLDTGRYADAVENLKKALQLRPNYPDALHSLGLAHLKIGNTPAALAQYDLLTVLDSAKASDLPSVPT